MNAFFRSSLRLLLTISLPLTVTAQTPTIQVSSTTVNINPSGTDSYNIQGSFTGLSLDGAQGILFSVGQFGMTIPLTAFVQQPGTNVYQYNDSTGMLPYWLRALPWMPMRTPSAPPPADWC